MRKGFLGICIILALLLLISCSNGNEEHEVNIEGLKKEILYIKEIKDDYFLAEHPWPTPYEYKVFADLDEDYCIGDYIDVYYDEMVKVDEYSYEITPILIEHSDFELKEGVVYKPVIYLYPTKKEKVTVSLDYNGIITYTYPTYLHGWTVTAYPDGTIVDENGYEYPYLFWEGKGNTEYDMTKGFCVSGDETEEFLREKLTFMGLNEKEVEDFIEFWIPFMEKNPYNKISFQNKEYTDNAKLTVNPEPDSIIRIFMVFQPLEEPVEIEEQPLTRIERRGFTLIEWGGSIKK